MNLKDEKIRALRTSIERINWLMQQPQYEELKPLIQVRKKDFQDELKKQLGDDYY